jgi:ABC-type Fe3+-hydroxamate transport system substrate-binding protein
VSARGGHALQVQFPTINDPVRRGGTPVHWPGMRIVSLHPAATDLVHLLGLDEALVGVSADSDWPPELVERVPVLNQVAIDTSKMSGHQIDAAARAVRLSIREQALAVEPFIAVALIATVRRILVLGGRGATRP